MYRRLITDSLLEALSDSPVVLILGARQTGKTTLVQAIAEGPHPAAYVTLDDAGFLSAARSDPVDFLAGFEGPVVIDEVQSAPELFPAIKLAVDKKRTPGRFLLTGSANVMVLPRLSESLAGRMQILTLWPLSQAEIEGRSSCLVDMLFQGRLLSAGPKVAERDDLIQRILAGGYPEPLGRSDQDRRRAWFGSYLTTILQRDVRDLAHIEGLTALPRLLSLLATRAGGLLNLADVSRTIGLPYTTLQRYLALLEATFLVYVLPAWSNQLGKRQTKAPKLLLNDTGLIGGLLGLDLNQIKNDSALMGSLFENFVAMEICKHAGWSRLQPRLYHYRTPSRQEVDLLLEGPNGGLVGVEVKATVRVDAGDFKGLRALAQAVGSRFVRGVVLYGGTSVIPFGENLHALPISVLWE